MQNSISPAGSIKLGSLYGTGVAASCSVGNFGHFFTTHSEYFAVDLLTLRITNKISLGHATKGKLGRIYFCFTAPGENTNMLYVAGSNSVVAGINVNTGTTVLNDTSHISLYNLTQQIPPQGMGQYFLNGTQSVWLTGSHNVIAFGLPNFRPLYGVNFSGEPWTVAILPTDDDDVVVIGTGKGEVCIQSYFPTSVNDNCMDLGAGHVYSVQTAGSDKLYVVMEYGIASLRVVDTKTTNNIPHRKLQLLHKVTTARQRELGCWFTAQDVDLRQSSSGVIAFQRGRYWVVYSFPASGAAPVEVTSFGPVDEHASRSCFWKGSELFIGAGIENKGAVILRVVVELA